MTIPASALSSVTPGVISAGGGSQSLTGLILTRNTRVPIGTVLSLASVAAVQAYFGVSSQEASLAGSYFSGFDNSPVKPAALLFFQYTGAAAVAAYLRGGNIGALGLADLQALSAGTLTVTVNGTTYTSASISLSGTSSFSAAAATIQAAFTSPPFTVTFDSVSGGFVFTSSTTGATSTITFASTDALATGLLLTSATGAILSQGAAVMTPSAAMASVVALNANWGAFMTTWEATVSDASAFALWTTQQDDDCAYIQWSTDITLTTTVPATASAAYAIQQAQNSGTLCLYAPVGGANTAAFVLGIGPSINFGLENGRKSYAYRTQSGLLPDVTSAQVAANLLANGVNFYGQYGNSEESLNILYPGSITGPFGWADSYFNQIWMNSSFASANLNLMATIGSLPYNLAGDTLIRETMAPVIAAAVAFGAIQSGVLLSGAQIADVNNAAGINIASTIFSQGWYLLIGVAAPSVRAARGPPPITFFYTDGQSIQSISLNSLEVA